MEAQHLYKIVLVGDWGVGKTNILSQYTRGEFTLGSAGTIGVQFSTRTLQVEGKTVKVQVWDTAGQDKFRAITSTYYRGAHGALLVYDITRGESFKRLENWVKELKEYVRDDCVIILIGNKIDLMHLAEVKTETGLAYAKSLNFAFFETSALDSTNIQNAFDLAIKQIHTIQSNSLTTDPDPLRPLSGKKVSIQLSEESLPKKKSCCS